MKVKIFCGSMFADVVEEMEEFLNTKINICKITQSESVCSNEHGDSYNITYTVFYYEQSKILIGSLKGVTDGIS